ncbi:uncharacterized protein LOC143372637 isoform X2 [Andrena cerasifolii]|uniref:uncharacterized protein LOC143372637 isoform X2 n=1 Tax=Andrena cerasifolii TaxID=2819439 RepID=UPI004037B576
MERRVLFLLTSVLVLDTIGAKPIPELENSDLELLVPKDTVHRGYMFWLGRPFYDQDDWGDNSYSGFQLNRRSSTVSYANVGAGWGR